MNLFVKNVFILVNYHIKLKNVAYIKFINL